MKKLWKDVKIGDVLKDGSIVTQIHQTKVEPCCIVTYDTNRTITCSYTHVFLIDVSHLSKEAKDELDQFCTFVPLEENYSIDCEDELSLQEKLEIERFCYSEPIDTKVVYIGSDNDCELYDFYFDKVKRVSIKNIVIKSEPQKVDENTYWLTCKGIKYLMDKYNKPLYCNGNIINKIEDAGELPCFCISTNTGRYET